MEIFSVCLFIFITLLGFPVLTFFSFCIIYTVCIMYVLQEFQAHKTIISRSSEVFQTMFYGSLAEKDKIRVTDVTPTAFQALLS
jgi:hypothetical protein